MLIRLETWPHFFTEDAHYRVCTRENFELGLPLCVMSCNGRGMLRDRIRRSARPTCSKPSRTCYCQMIGALRILECERDHVKTESNVRGDPDNGRWRHDDIRLRPSLDTLFTGCTPIRLSERIVILDLRQIDTLLVIPL